MDSPDVKGLWIVGPPGCGKSSKVRSNYSPFYLKAQNKWWDGYKGEPYVLIDDFDKQGACLAHYIKIWADRYHCYGEIKGGTVPLAHTRLIITSNYFIEDIWPGADNITLRDAINRRFIIDNMN